jgi:hypothetical protein
MQQFFGRMRWIFLPFRERKVVFVESNLCFSSDFFSFGAGLEYEGKVEASNTVSRTSSLCAGTKSQ